MLQSCRVYRGITTNVLYWRRARIVVPKFSICTMLNSSTTAQFITYACLLPIHCCTLFFFDNQHFTNYFKNSLIIFLKKFAVSNKCIIFVMSIRQ